MLESGEVGDGVRDEFPDAELFKVNAKAAVDGTVAGEDKWLTDIHQFLSTRFPREELSQDECKCLAVESRHFCLVDPQGHSLVLQGVRYANK